MLIFTIKIFVLDEKYQLQLNSPPWTILTVRRLVQGLEMSVSLFQHRQLRSRPPLPLPRAQTHITGSRTFRNGKTLGISNWYQVTLPSSSA